MGAARRWPRWASMGIVAGGCWLLWVQGAESRTDSHWGGRYSFAEFQARLAHVPRVEQVHLADAGHMLHHDQPEALAAALRAFLD